VVVSLNRWSADTFAYDRGSVVIIDPATDMVTQQVVLGDLKNCEGLDYVEATKSVLVACGRIVRLARASAGVGCGGRGHAHDARRPVAHHLRGRVSDAARDVLVGDVAAVRDQPAARVHVHAGQLQPQRARPPLLLRFHHGRDDVVRDASPFDMGRPAGASGRLLVPDANAAMPRIHVYDVSGAAPTEGQAFVSDSANGLPPREIAWY
jgi:hypothetical protein